MSIAHPQKLSVFESMVVKQNSIERYGVLTKLRQLLCRILIWHTSAFLQPLLNITTGL